MWKNIMEKGMEIGNVSVQVQDQPVAVCADDLFESAPIPLQKTAVATFAVIHGRRPPFLGFHSLDEKEFVFSQ